MDYIPVNNDTISPEKARFLNPLVLAFVGDSAQQLMVRARLCCEHDAKAGQLHVLASQEIKASTQAKALENILPFFTEDEMDIYKRARNCKSTTIAKNASYVEYKKASGFEAVIGYLYLIGDTNRIKALLDQSKIDQPCARSHDKATTNNSIPNDTPSHASNIVQTIANKGENENG